MSLLVLSCANHVRSRRITVEKEETPVAFIVQQVGPPKMAVPSAKRVVLEPMVLGVKIVRWDTREKQTTMMLRSVNSVKQVKQQRCQVRQHAVGVI